MDWRHIELPRITFDRIKPSRWKVRYGGGGEVQFQMPTYTAAIEPHPRVPCSRQIRGCASHHPAFRDFIQSLKKHTEAALEGDCASKEYKESFNTLTIFESTLAFDSEGGVTHLKDGSFRLTPMVKIDGIWTSDFSWGYRVDVTQVKIHDRLAPPPPVRDTVKVFIDGKPLLFLPDD